MGFYEKDQLWPLLPQSAGKRVGSAAPTRALVGQALQEWLRAGALSQVHPDSSPASALSLLCDVEPRDPISLWDCCAALHTVGAQLTLS